MISVVGLGNAGLPLAAIIAENAFKVIGIDLDAGKCKLINKGINPLKDEPLLGELIKKHGGKTLIASVDFNKASQCTVYIIIVP
ncbi:MAG: nucleotide sugar dehydrogenase, partial [Candidatus Odinarchaeia archaeon]